MIVRKTAVAALLTLGAMTVAHSRDDTLMIPMEEVIQMGMADGKLDGSVKFYMSGAHTPQVSAKLGEDVSNKKTNGVGKDDQSACRWVALSAVIAFQESAKKKGANAVVDLHSYYKRNAVRNPVNFECHAGNVIVGVALKGTYASIR